MPRGKPFPPEFKKEAVRLHRASSGRSINQTAAEIGISYKALRSWVRQAEIDEGKATGTSSEEREELKRLRRENKLLKEEKAHHSVSLLARVLGVTKSGYYAWKTRMPSKRKLYDEELKGKIIKIHEDSFRIYGYPRVHAELAAVDVRIGKKRVARLMKELCIEGISKKANAKLQRSRKQNRLHRISLRETL